MQEVQLEPHPRRDFLKGQSVPAQADAHLRPYEPVYQEEAAEEGSLFVEYIRTVLRHKRLIGGLAIAGVISAFFLHLTTDPLYRSRTSLDIQSLNGDFMNLRSVDPMGDANSNDTNIQTQIKLLQSDSLRDRVEEHITSEAHPASVERKDLLSRIWAVLHIGNPATISFRSLLEETSKQTKVKQMGMTRLVEVSCASWDAAFASRYCNTLAREFVAEDLENRGSEAKQTSEWLMRQAADVKQKSEETERRLFAATGGNGLILSQQSDTVGEDRLRQLQSELVKAQADRMEKEAEASVANRSSANSTPSVVSDPSYAASRARLGDLQAQVAALVPPLTEDHPKVIHLRAQIKQLQDNMLTQRSDSAQRLRNEYAAAKHREDLLTLSYNAQEASVSADMEKGSQVALLRRELESEQQLYQTLLQKAKEAGFASAMHASTIRVVDEARQPRFAAYPQRLTTTLIGALAGLAVGLGLAFFKDRNVTVLRTPGDAAKLLNADELGIIPAATTLRSWSERLSQTAKKARLISTSSALAVRPKASTERKDISSAGWDDPFSIVAEAYRNTTFSLLLKGGSSPQKAYIVSSPNTEEGKTTITTNLGIALSRAKLRVALVDGDLRRPSLHRAFSVSNTAGLRNLLNGDTDLNEASVLRTCQRTRFDGLQIIPSGTGTQDSGDLLHSPNLKKFLELMRTNFDVVLVDTPPALHMIDARLLGKQVDGAILVVRSGKTTRESAASALDLFVNDRTRVIGTILNDFDAARQGQHGYYSSYYAYHGRAEGSRHMVNS